MNLQNIKAIIESKGYEVEMQEVTHGSERTTGFNFKINDKLRINLYPDFTLSDEQNAIDLVARFEGHKNNVPVFDTSVITEWEKAKKNLKLCVRKPVDDFAITRDYLDLQVYVKVQVDDSSTTTVTDKMLDSWGINEKMLFLEAMGNQQYTATKMGEALSDFIEDDEDIEAIRAADDVAPMYVVSNESKWNGASAIYDTSYLKALAGVIGGDFYIIPSSIHEIICIKDLDDISELNQIIQDVNATLDPAERLSDHFYKYEVEANKVVY